MAYLLIQEGRTAEGRAEVDEMLNGPKPSRRTERAAMVATLGGDVRGGNR